MGRPRVRADANLGTDGRWRGPDGRLLSAQAVAVLATHPGATWRDDSGRRRTLRPLKAPKVEAGRRPKRARPDAVAAALEATRFAGGRGQERIEVYTPKASFIQDVSKSLATASAAVSDSKFGAGRAVYVVAQLVMPDGSTEWRSLCHAGAPSAAFAQASGRLRDWARGMSGSARSTASPKWARGKRWSTDYRATRIASIQVLRSAMTIEGERSARDAKEQDEREGARWRRQIARDRRRNTRTTRGR